MSENPINNLPAACAYTLGLATVARLNEIGVPKVATGACIEILARGDLLVVQNRPGCLPEIYTPRRKPEKEAK